MPSKNWGRQGRIPPGVEFKTNHKSELKTEEVEKKKPIKKKSKKEEDK